MNEWTDEWMERGESRALKEAKHLGLSNIKI